MKRETLFTKVIAMLICAMMVIGYLPTAALADDWEADMDVVLGSEGNPVDAVLGDNTAEEGLTECYWAYTAEYTGTLVITSSAAVTVNGTAYALEADATEVSVELDVTAADEVSICSLNFNLAYKAGSCADVPLYVEWVWNDDYTEATASVTVPAGKTVYCADWSISSSNILTANGETVTVTYGTPRMSPSSWTLTNSTDADAEYALVLSYKAGTSSNPAVAVLGDNAASIEAGSQGYYFTYTADYTGNLVVTISGADQWTYVINNLTTYVYGDTQWSDSDPVVNPATIAVTAGDKIQIIVNSYDSANPWEAPAADLNVNLDYEAGSCPEVPLYVEWVWNDDYTEATATVTVPAGETVYYADWGLSSSNILTANGGTVEVTYGTPRMSPSFWTLTNSTEADAEYALVLTYKVGTSSNAAVAVLGDNAASIEAGSQGYYFTYTADYTGDLVVTISGADQWTYVINNLTSYVYGDTQWSDSDPVVNPATIAVTAGDEIQIIVNSYDSANPWDAPAAELHVNLAYEAGSCPEVPLYVEWVWNDDYTEATATVTVPAGETVYYADWGVSSSNILTANGETVGVTYGTPRMSPSSWTLTNSADTDAEYALVLTYKAGTYSNPAVAVLGDNAASIEAGSQGYYWTYTAEKDGDLIITINTTAGWVYCVNNMTTYQYGDTQWSDSDPVVNPTTITVAAGDVIQIMVNGYDPENPWEAPAAEITVNLAYKEVVLPSGNAALKISGATLTLQADLKVAFAVKPEVLEAYSNVYFKFKLDGKEVIISDSYYNTANGRQMYTLPGVAPRMMNDVIEIEMYGTYEGVEYVYTNTYTVMTYCNSQLGKVTEATKLTTLIVDLMNFGTMQQIYNDYKTDALINASLTEAQKAWGRNVNGDQTFTSVFGLSGENGTAYFRGASLTLSDAVVVNYVVQTDDLTGITLKITVDGEETIIDSEAFVLVEGYTNRYEVKFTGLRARQMRSTITAVVLRDGVETSKTATYSVESYAAGVTSGTNLYNLCQAMMHYGDAAIAYFNS